MTTQLPEDATKKPVEAGIEAAYLLEQIKAHADPQHRAWTDSIVPSGRRAYGARVPDLRRIARKWRLAHPETTHGDLVTLVNALWSGESREERVLAVLLLEEFNYLVPELTRADFDRWRSDLDNWGECDGLGWVLASWLLAEPSARMDYLWVLIGDDDVWSRRAALVATARINRGRTGFTVPDLTLKLIDQVKTERHPMITKAVSWALREMTRKHPDQVVAYLKRSEDSLAAHVRREVNNKLRTGLKSGKGGVTGAS